MPIPIPGPSQALIRVTAPSINFLDILLCQGKYQLKLEPPFTSGMNLVGEVVALSEGAEGAAVVAWVVASVRQGAFAEYALAEAGSLQLVPEGMSAAENVTYPSAYLTGWASLVRCANLQPGEAVLVHGAGGGTWLATLDLAKILSAAEFATSASDAKLVALWDYGADHPINLTDGFANQVKALTGGGGAEMIYDPVGGDVCDEPTRCISFEDWLLVIGLTSGRFATLRTNHALIKGASVVGVRAGEYGQRFPKRGRENRQANWGLANSGHTRPRGNAELPLSETLAGFAMLRNREVIGKVVVHCDL